MNKIIKKILPFIMLFSMFVVPVFSHAQLLNNDAGTDLKENMKDSGRGGYNVEGGEDGDFLLSDVFSMVVRAFLGLLGVIFLIMIILGGFNWMTAAGSEDKVSKAKATLYRGVIGLIIVVAAYMITAFVFKALGDVIGAPGV